MASDEKELEATGRGRRGGRPGTKPATDGSPGLLRVLWADVRKQELPQEPDPEEMEWLEEERAIRQELAMKFKRVHCVGEDKRDTWRRRYWNN